MRKLSLLSLAFAGVAGLSLCGCSDDINLADQMKEDYVKSFIEKYGVPGEGNTFSVAKRGQVTVKSKAPTYVEVVAQENGKFYSFAYQQVAGTETVQFDIPSHISEVYVYANDAMLPVKLGGVCDLDNPSRSRDGEAVDPEYWTNVAKGIGNSTYLPYTPIDAGDGRLSVDFSSLSESETDNNGIGGTSGIFKKVLGSEMKQYVSDNPEVYKKYDNHGSGMSTGYPDFFMTIFNVNKPDPTHEYEIGVYYGNKQTLLTSDEVVFIPLYRTDAVADGSVIHNYSVREDNLSFEKAGVQFEIEFSDINFKDEANKDAENTGKFNYVQTQYFTTETSSFGRNMTKDNKATYGASSLEAMLERHAAVQSQIPSFSVLANGATDYEPNLPVLESCTDKWEFYDNYDAYIWSWLNDPAHSNVKSQVNEFIQFKEMIGSDSRYTPKHAIPYVKKLSDHKYRVSYYTAYNTKDAGACARYENASGLSLCNIQDDQLYRCTGVEVRVPGAGTVAPHEFTVYMRDLTDGTLVSCADGSHVKSVARHIQSGDVMATVEFGITMVDFDGDGIYNDFVYRHSIPGGSSNPGPKFEPYTWYLACEDLGSTGDCDFNDAVFAIKYMYGASYTIQNIEVWPLAAGGIYPTYLMWNDGTTNYMVGKELHSWLGNDVRDEDGNLQFINTETYNPNLNPGRALFEYDVLAHNMNEFSVSELQDAHWGSGTMAGFWVLVDKDNAVAKANLANTSVKFEPCDAEGIKASCPGVWEVNNQPINGGNSAVPQMMLVGQSWEWPIEKTNISEGYPSFVSWIKASDPTSVKWYGEDAGDVKREHVVKRWE